MQSECKRTLASYKHKVGVGCEQKFSSQLLTYCSLPVTVFIYLIPLGYSYNDNNNTVSNCKDDIVRL